ncbi:HDOD domain-containing protein [Rhodanobacter sp. AS-Z3]|uniref:HDOD domain-containing protein n=1 Tax=Rhodanobacter sp. AS-Z3 TaxID=3031330 RepID=UPI0024785562|nr:HDOD domain-containing protein [Rhodanobacter sp. AS-Z3]WEN14187.1 HDOD domain-containing protein [Rhodanobacter sp. AS-Z3]
MPEPPAEQALASRVQLEELFHRFVLDLPESSLVELTPNELALVKRLDLLSVRFDMRSLPRLPSVLPQLLRELRSDTAAGAQLAKLIARDPLLIGEVMRVTSSVFYRSAQPITSLQQAVVLLGQDTLRQVVAQHVMKPILQANTGSGGQSAGVRLWEHAERCAHASAFLARNAGGDAFESYLAGIIARTGTGAVVRLLETTSPLNEAPVSAAFLAECDHLAARLSLQAAQHWELPARVVEAVAEMQLQDAKPISTLGKILVVADLLAMEQVLGEHARLPKSVEADCGNLLPASTVERCRKDLRSNFENTHA